VPKRSDRRDDGRRSDRRDDYKHSDRSEGGEPRRKSWDVSSGTLPKWISEELARVTPKEKLTAAAEKLTQAAEAFAGGKHGRALRFA